MEKIRSGQVNVGAAALHRQNDSESWFLGSWCLLRSEGQLFSSKVRREISSFGSYEVLNKTVAGCSSK